MASASPLVWWYKDGDLVDNIEKAVARFEARNGVRANTVWLNSKDFKHRLDKATLEWIEGHSLVVKAGKYVLEDHFRVGIEEGARGRENREKELVSEED